MLRSNLRYSIIEGSFFALMFGFGENYLSALGVFLGYSALQISVLGSFPQLIAAIAQLISNTIAKQFSSMKMFCVSLAFIQSMLWIILIFIIVQTSSYYVILAWLVLYATIGSIIGPIWISWVGYLVPARLRPNYHANRNRTIHFLIFVSIMLGGLILRYYDSDKLIGFSIMFAIAALGRMLSSYYLNKKTDAGQAKDGDRYTYLSMFRDRKKFYFMVFNTAIHFAVMFLGPLFTIYIIRTMDLSYMVLTLCMVTWWMGNVFSLKAWGRLSKERGNLYLLKLSSIVMCVLPALWIGVYYFDDSGRIIVSLVINLLAGATFSGFGLSAFNLLYEICDSDEVVKFSSLVNFLKGVGIFVGSVIAGYIVDSGYLIELLSGHAFTTIQLSMCVSIALRCLSLVFLYRLERA